ncbi:hypothetical protein [Bradyrhizobium neotropicale]|uniref:hypothetical protein n=1 Tax=Bradyrhizobium neotropicale TaxID=1497615 RepID=UPI0011AB3B8A|nr:hypothetical protein [Bradyrhizobium neotropicale]
MDMTALCEAILPVLSQGARDVLRLVGMYPLSRVADVLVEDAVTVEKNGGFIHLPGTLGPQQAYRDRILAAPTARVEEANRPSNTIPRVTWES